jgi:hypothetical protein
MESVTEARRAKFEALFPAPYYVQWNTDRQGYYSINRDSTRKRGAECYDSKWQGYNAALDSLVIELPSHDQYFEDEARCAVDACREAIEKAGARVNG